MVYRGDGDDNCRTEAGSKWWCIINDGVGVSGDDDDNSGNGSGGKLVMKAVLMMSFDE